jgi:hypothetical protein
MSQIVFDAIDREMAKLEPLVHTPSGDLGYGVDLSCVMDADENLTEVDPMSPLGIGQATLRRLITPRGSLQDAPNDGIDIRSYCNHGVPADELRDLSGILRLESTKDDRIADAAVTVTTPYANALHVDVRITPEDPALAAFSLVFAATPETLTVERLG